MVDVDKMNDAEIRSKLIEFGFPVMPITGTTRKTMVKKLKLLMDGNKKKTNDRKSMGQFSSEEESDTEIKTLKRDKSRRATMGAPLIQSTTTRTKVPVRKVIREDDSQNHASESVPTAKRIVTTTTTKVTKTVQDGFDTGSDSEPEVIEKNDYGVPSKFTTNNFDHKKDSSIRASSSSTYSTVRSPTSRYTPPKTNNSSISSPAAYPSSILNRINSPSRYAPSPGASSDAALDNLQTIRSRLSLGTSSGFDRPLSTSSPQPAEENAETPYLSDFANRLSQLSSIGSPKKYDYKNDIIKEHDTNGAGTYARGNVGRLTRNRDINRDYYSRHNSNILKDNIVSFAVLGIAILFFIAVGAMYYGMRSSGSELDTIGYYIPLCEKLDSNSIHGVNCIRKEDIEGAIDVMKLIRSELSRVAVEFICQDSSIKPYMTETDVVNYHKKKLNAQVTKTNISQNLAHLQILILKNPEWGISLIEIDGTSNNIGENNIVRNVDELALHKARKQIGLATLNPDIPWGCAIYNKIYTICNIMLTIIIGCVLLIVFNYGYLYFKRYQDKQKAEVFKLVEEITDTLQANTDEDFLVINHVRDMILPLNERKGKEAIWNQAIKFINENESRIRTEIQTVHGEPCKVWRWLGSAMLNASTSSRSKTWQGQAFETQVGSVNSLPYSPTPCLKIRGMVDDEEKNLIAIKEAVLSKCAHRCRILHCGVDSLTKCVYLKCVDQNDAAVAYRNLHGWWYAGHLVTVKYLRLERYMQRFPESPVSGPPFLKSLSPTNDEGIESNNSLSEI